jgi:hypothetical protein
MRHGCGGVNAMQESFMSNLCQFIIGQNAHFPCHNNYFTDLPQFFLFLSLAFILFFIFLLLAHATRLVAADAV